VLERKEKRQVSEIQIKEYARINELLYIGECSAKNDINVHKTLDSLIKQIYFNNKEELLKDGTVIRSTTHLNGGNNLAGKKKNDDN
jgi:hypothetical protein